MQPRERRRPRTPAASGRGADAGDDGPARRAPAATRRSPAAASSRGARRPRFSFASATCTRARPSTRARASTTTGAVERNDGSDGGGVRSGHLEVVLPRLPQHAESTPRLPTPGRAPRDRRALRGVAAVSKRLLLDRARPDVRDLQAPAAAGRLVRGAGVVRLLAHLHEHDAPVSGFRPDGRRVLAGAAVRRGAGVRRLQRADERARHLPGGGDHAGAACSFLGAGCDLFAGLSCNAETQLCETAQDRRHGGGLRPGRQPASVLRERWPVRRWNLPGRGRRGRGVRPRRRSRVHHADAVYRRCGRRHERDLPGPERLDLLVIRAPRELSRGVRV